MKSFLDRFRRKGPEKDSGKKPETAGDIAAAEALQQGYSPTLKRREPIIPERAGVTRESASGGAAASSAAASPPATAATAAVASRKEETITFELGDFIQRIPEKLLALGDHDPKTQLVFDVGELSGRIAKGQTTIPLSDLYRRVPNVFRGEIRDSDNIDIRFPWQKLLELVKSTGGSERPGGLSEAAADALAQKLRARKRNVGFSGAGGVGTERTQPRVTGAAVASTPGPVPARQPSWFSRPTTERPPIAPSPPAAPAQTATRESAEPPAVNHVAKTKEFEQQTAAASASGEATAVPEGLSTAPELAPGALVPEQPAAVQPDLFQAEAPCISKKEGASAKREFERRLAALEEEKRQLTQARDMALADLAKVLREIDQHRDEAEMQRTLAEQTGHTAVKAASERNAIQKELDQLRSDLAAKTADFSSLQEQLHQAASASDSHGAAVEKLRREFEQQLAVSQVEATKRGEEFTALERQLDEFRSRSAEQVAALTAERDHLLSEKDSATKQLSREKSYFEQLQHTAEAGLAAIVDERDRLKYELEQRAKHLAFTETRLAEVERNAAANVSSVAQERDRLRSELESKVAAQAERKGGKSQKSVQAQIAGLTEERDRFREEAENRAGQLASLQEELGQLRQALDARLGCLTQERDALVQQKAHLSEQLAQLQKVGVRVESLPVEGERNKREYERQADELKRRIIALETSQRENASELTREREARIKAERTAAAADRARGEAAALVESLRNDLKREADANNRRRDAEFARTQKELQDKVEALTDSVRKLQSERDGFAAEVSKLRESAGEGETVSANEWHNRVTATFEADIENYRARIKTLLKEKEMLTKEREQRAVPPTDSSGIDELKKKSEQLDSELRAALAERDELAAAAKNTAANAELTAADENLPLDHLERDRLLAQISNAAATQEKLATEAEAERQRFFGEIKKVRDELAHADAVRQRQGEELSRLQQAHSTLVQESAKHRDNLIRERDVARKRAEALQAEIDELLTRTTAGGAAEEELAAVRRQIEQSQRTIGVLTAERNQLKEALASTTAGLATATSSNASAEQLASLRADLEVAQTENSKLTAELRSARDEAKAALTARHDFNQDQSAVESAHAALEQNLSSMTRSRDAAATLVRDLETRLNQLQSSVAAKDSELERLRADHDRLMVVELRQRETASNLQQELEPRLAAFQKERDELFAELEATRERAKTSLRNQEKQAATLLAALTEERDAARRESSAVAQRLAGMAVEADEKVASMQRQLDILATEKAAVAGELGSVKGGVDQQSAIFARELKMAAMQRDEAIAASESSRDLLRKQAAEFSRERADIERSVEERLARLERDVTRLRRDRDALLRQREELREKIGTMVEQQKKLVEDLTVHTTKSAPLPTDIGSHERESCEPREPNVIDITEAEILHPGDSDASGVRPPRVRPVIVRPPNLRVL